MNPVKLDPRSSRCAGPIVKLGNRLFRPAQDCSRAYGGGVTWCEICELTTHTFTERVVARLSPNGRYTGLHTYSRAGGFEVIDFRRARYRGISGLRRKAQIMTAGGRYPSRMIVSTDPDREEL